MQSQVDNLTVRMNEGLQLYKDRVIELQTAEAERAPMPMMKDMMAKIKDISDDLACTAVSVHFS